jgi:regulator of sigma D
MSNKASVISMMVKQHRNLQGELNSVADILQADPAETKKIIELLEKFRKDLSDHVCAESKLFYLELLKEMEERGQDTSKTKLFIEEMGELAKDVYAFLDKYQEAEKIDREIAVFKEEFAQILRALNLRIESEEVGVFAYWVPADF